jgi:hypothetical protein
LTADFPHRDLHAMLQRSTRSLCLALGLLAFSCQSTGGVRSNGLQVVHSVYFTLRDDTDKARAALVEACYDKLADLPGVVAFSAGVREERIDGAANDRDFDVALLVVFVNREAHDRYLIAPQHVAFVDAQRPNWQVVRVFDSLAGQR